ncbi:MAG TPA: hypothetical protein VGD40_09655 [Chryseosolibacter sp.]
MRINDGPTLGPRFPIAIGTLQVRPPTKANALRAFRFYRYCDRGGIFGNEVEIGSTNFVHGMSMI